MLDEQGVLRAVAALRRARDTERERISRIRGYVENRACDIYAPAEATSEYRQLVDQAKFNIMPLVVGSVAQRLVVAGYRSTTDPGAQSPLWSSVWQANRLDKRQGPLYRSALRYGAAYTVVLPGEPGPVVHTLSPWHCTTLYADVVNDEWPVVAMTWDRDENERLDPAVAAVLGPPTLRVFDDTHVYTLEGGAVSGAGRLVDVSEHGLGVCPVVRFSNDEDLDTPGLGKVEPLIELQQQINQTTFRASMTEQFQAFRQRWATGMAIELDDDDNPVEPFTSWVDSLWTNESPDAKFGEFTEANLGQYLEQRNSQLLFAAAAAKIPPYYLLIGGIANISLDTITALEAAHRQDISDHQQAYGEGWEQTMRLAALALGDEAAAGDESAQVVWDDTTPRSLGQLVDALGKMAAQLGIPPQMLWERLPGWTDQDTERASAMAGEAGLMGELQALFDAEQAAPQGQEVVGAVAGSDTPDGLA